MKCPSCVRRIAYPLVMCAPCWKRLDPRARERISAAWTPGPPNDDFVAELIAAAKTVQIID